MRMKVDQTAPKADLVARPTCLHCGYMRLSCYNSHIYKLDLRGWSEKFREINAVEQTDGSESRYIEDT